MQKKVEEKPKIPKYYFWLLGLILLVMLVYIFWPKTKVGITLTPSNFALIRPQMTKADVKRIIGSPPGDYRTANKGAAARFDAPAGGGDQEIWETNFGGYCVIYDASGAVIRVDRKPPL